MANFEEVLHGGGKDWIAWPVIGVPGLVVAANLEGLFEVGVDAAESGDEGRVGELGYFFAAVGDVAAVGLGGGLERVSWCWGRGEDIRTWPVLEYCDPSSVGRIRIPLRTVMEDLPMPTPPFRPWVAERTWPTRRKRGRLRLAGYHGS